MTDERHDGGDTPRGARGDTRADGAPPAEPEHPADGGTPASTRRARGGRIAALEAELEERERALQQQDDRYRRLAADFENFRRRTASELADRSRHGSEAAARELLPVLDNLRRATEHLGGDGTEQLREGLTLVVRAFEEALARIGVQPIESVGRAFDPALHDAVAGEESDEVETETVIDELQRGYRLHDRVLRPAMVRIAHPRAG